jgi:hypothetical protein
LVKQTLRLFVFSTHWVMAGKACHSHTFGLTRPLGESYHRKDKEENDRQERII